MVTYRLVQTGTRVSDNGSETVPLPEFRTHETLVRLGSDEYRRDHLSNGEVWNQGSHQVTLGSGMLAFYDRPASDSSRSGHENMPFPGVRSQFGVNFATLKLSHKGGVEWRGDEPSWPVNLSPHFTIKVDSQGRYVSSIDINAPFGFKTTIKYSDPKHIDGFGSVFTKANSKTTGPETVTTVAHLDQLERLGKEATLPTIDWKNVLSVNDLGEGAGLIIPPRKIQSANNGTLPATVTELAEVLKRMRPEGLRLKQIMIAKAAANKKTHSSDFFNYSIYFIVFIAIVASSYVFVRKRYTNA